LKPAVQATASAADMPTTFLTCPVCVCVCVCLSVCLSVCLRRCREVSAMAARRLRTTQFCGAFHRRRRAERQWCGASLRRDWRVAEAWYGFGCAQRWLVPDDGRCEALTLALGVRRCGIGATVMRGSFTGAISPLLCARLVGLAARRHSWPTERKCVRGLLSYPLFGSTEFWALGY
jgi:hypothetical protein